MGARFGSSGSDWEYSLWGSNEMGLEWQVAGEHSVGASEEFGFCVPKVLESVKSSHALSAAASADGGGTPKARGTSKVSISGDTHFVPIKCESMEAAYNPGRPKFDLEGGEEAEGGGYATETFENEEYYVLRQPVAGSGKRKVEMSRESSEKSLRLKFKARLPEKECQTEKFRDAGVMTVAVEQLDGLEEWEKYQWTDSPVVLSPMSVGGESGGMDRSNSFLAQFSQTVDTRDRTVPLASGCSVWEDQPNTMVEDWLASGSGGMGLEHPLENQAPASQAFGVNYTVEDHDRSMDEDELLLKYVSSISLISQLNAAN